MSNILVTGGLGFIGSNLVDKLVDDHNVYVIDNLSSNSSNDSYRNYKATYIIDDIEKIEQYNLPHIDIIFHLAACARIQPSFDNPLHVIKNNAMKTGIICEYARHNDSRIIYAGSSSFYGGTTENPYTFSKWQGEQICNMYTEIFDVDTVTARFFNVYGNHQPMNGEYATVVGKFLRQYRNGEDLTIVGDGNQRRDFTHIDDICSGLIKLAFSTYQGIYNLGTGYNYSIKEIVDIIIENGYNDIKKIYQPKRPGEARNTLADISKTKKDLNWKPIHKLEDYLITQVQK